MNVNSSKLFAISTFKFSINSHMYIPISAATAATVLPSATATIPRIVTFKISQIHILQCIISLKTFIITTRFRKRRRRFTERSTISTFRHLEIRWRNGKIVVSTAALSTTEAWIYFMFISKNFLTEQLFTYDPYYFIKFFKISAQRYQIVLSEIDDKTRLMRK